MNRIHFVILELEPVERGALRAFVTVQVGPLVIYGARYIQQTGQRGYVAPPQVAIPGSDSQPRYRPMLKWPEQWKQPLLDAVTEALADHPHGIRQRPATDFGREFHRRAGFPDGIDRGQS